MKLIIILFLGQVVVAAVILAVLWALLKKELFRESLRMITGRPPDPAVRDVTVVSASVISAEDDARIKQALALRFPNAAVVFAVNGELKAGLVVKAGDDIVDTSFLTRAKHLLGQQDA